MTNIHKAGVQMTQKSQSRVPIVMTIEFTAALCLNVKLFALYKAVIPMNTTDYICDTCNTQIRAVLNRSYLQYMAIESLTIRYTDGIKAPVS